MLPSQAFSKKARQRVQAFPENEDRCAAEIRELFGAFLPEMSQDLQIDFFQYYWERYLDTEEATIYDFINWLGPVIDLFRGFVDAVEDNFSDEEWEMIRMAIDEGADTMDIRLLNTLAAYLVKNKRY